MPTRKTPRLFKEIPINETFQMTRGTRQELYLVFVKTSKGTAAAVMTDSEFNRGKDLPTEKELKCKPEYFFNDDEPVMLIERWQTSNVRQLFPRKEEP